MGRAPRWATRSRPGRWDGSCPTAGPPDQPCLIGSVKTNIGHLEAGAGIAGLIKAALALHHRRIPGNLHFDRPNPEIDFERLRLECRRAASPGRTATAPLVAGVNSFGFGGTNAHVVLQEAPDGAIARTRARTSVERPAVKQSGRCLARPVCRPAVPRRCARSARSWRSSSRSARTDVSLDEIAANAALATHPSRSPPGRSSPARSRSWRSG